MVQVPIKSIPAEIPATAPSWVDATWDEFLQITAQPGNAKAKAYFFNYQMRIEPMGVGADHGWDNTIILFAINLFCTIAGIPIAGLTNTSYRFSGDKEVQPDLSYYIGDRAALTPKGGQIVNLNEQPIPDLAIEIADSSLSDDLGKKRLLYEAIDISEYWVIDVERSEIIAFAIASLGSHRISTSTLLPGLTFSVLETALVKGRSQNQTEIGQWLIQQFQHSS
jgi:Uma2 family endonuclease